MYILIVTECAYIEDFYAEAHPVCPPCRTLKQVEQAMGEHFAALLIENGHLVPLSNYKLFKYKKGELTLAWVRYMTDLKEELYPTYTVELPEGFEPEPYPDVPLQWGQD